MVPPEVIFWGAKSFCTAISVHSNANCSKAFIKKPSAHHNFKMGGGFPGSLVPSQNRFSLRLSCFSGRPGPLGCSTGLGEHRELPQQGLGRFRAF